MGEAKSDAYSRRVLEVEARFRPELVSHHGYRAADGEVSPLGPGAAEGWIAALGDLAEELGQQVGSESDREVRFDLELLLADCERNLDVARLEHELLLPYQNLPQRIFQGFWSLLDAHRERDRRRAAIARLRRYSGVVRGTVAIARQLEDTVRSRLGSKDLLPPCREVVERDLATSTTYLEEIRRLLEARGVDGWRGPYDQLRRQIERWDRFVRDAVLPRARPGFRLPPVLYAAYLRYHDVDMPAAEISGRAKAAIREIRRELTMLRRAAPRSKIADRKLLAHYRARLRELWRRIQRHDVLSLPEEGPRLRLASAAASAWMPFPSTVYPPTVESLGEPVAIVIPRCAGAGSGETSGSSSGDSPTLSWLLMTHELGHALQYAALARDGLPLARKCFGTSSAMEGWAVYLEAELLPHLPPAVHGVFLRRQLLRAVRAVVEVDLHLGELSAGDALRRLRDEALLPAPPAAGELRRFLVMPGHAPSYFVGAARASELRTDVELHLGKRFHRREYHDFVLGQGVVSSAGLRRRILEDYVSRHSERLAA